MTGTQGIAPDGTRILLCGLSYRQVVSVAGEGVSQKEAATRLGVAYAHFNQVIKRHGMSHWFEKPKQSFTNCISKEDILQTAVEGYTMKDAAFILGICDRHMKRLVAQWELNKYFPNSGKAAWISRTGYAR
jgi:hypothetical protein